MNAVGSTVADRLAVRERWLLATAVVAAVSSLAVLGLVPPTTSVPVQAALAAAAAAAFLCGSLGLGFGAFLVPALLLLDVEPRVAVASSLISQLVVVPLGGASHASFGHVRARVVTPLLAAGILGTALGAQFSISIDAVLLAILIAGSTILMGILVLVRGAIEREAASLREDGSLGWPVIVGIGLIAGFAAAAFGTGWGPVGVSLLLLAGTLPKLAIGSSVTARGPIALSATLAYLVIAGPQQIVELDVLLPIVAGGAFGILAGSVVTRRLPDRRLRQAVGAAIVVLGLLVLFKV